MVGEEEEEGGGRCAQRRGRLCRNGAGNAAPHSSTLRILFGPVPMAQSFATDRQIGQGRTGNDSVWSSFSKRSS